MVCTSLARTGSKAIEQRAELSTRPKPHVISQRSLHVFCDSDWMLRYFCRSQELRWGDWLMSTANARYMAMAIDTR